ncbi:uncharacterized protein LOC133309831 isoform X2 [Gastrolobium bilobum]|uniref:uncharacterized protein LOC133309831 isoform X2 n=1 Tax=Gastrolobium bilobum TaxID=150636 RepID=UPI002AB218A9|nr:uncharacterized protein LOC133309831 isoform X2 [Gastrolobium bilobum]
MSVPHLRNSRVSLHLLISSIFFINFPGLVLSSVVTLSSIEIFTTHEWLKATPTVYFLCKGDNRTELPDVKKKHVLYAFKGEESWQPMTNFSSKKCKRCGFYEEDSFIADDVFDEWELCPSDFTAPDGVYVRFKEKEFNASFLCPECLSFSGISISPADGSHHDGKGMHVAVVVLLSLLVSAILILGGVGAYKYWQKKKREQDQARFLKLFEEGDDIEDELGLGTMI